MTIIDKLVLAFNKERKKEYVHTCNSISFLNIFFKVHRTETKIEIFFHVEKNRAEVEEEMIHLMGDRK